MALEWIAEPPGLAAVGFVLGLVIGSFLNVVVHRLPAGESIVSPRSRCPRCRVTIAARDNVPLLSYLLLRGRCRHCGADISLRYPFVELLTGCLYALVLWRFGATWPAPVFLVFVSGLLIAALVDFDHRIIPDQISLGGIAFGLVAAPAARALTGESWMDGFTTSLLGGVLGGALLWSVAFFHARISVALGRRYEHWPGEGEEPPGPASADYYLWFPGMGLGDIKLLAMVGVFLGPWGVLLTILFASLLGLLLGVASAIATRSFSTPFGFGPAIAVGALVALLAPLPAALTLG